METAEASLSLTLFILVHSSDKRSHRGPNENNRSRDGTIKDPHTNNRVSTGFDNNAARAWHRKSPIMGSRVFRVCVVLKIFSSKVHPSQGNSVAPALHSGENPETRNQVSIQEVFTFSVGRNCFGQMYLHSTYRFGRHVGCQISAEFFITFMYSPFSKTCTVPSRPNVSICPDAGTHNKEHGFLGSHYRYQLSTHSQPFGICLDLSVVRLR